MRGICCSHAIDPRKYNKKRHLTTTEIDSVIFKAKVLVTQGGLPNIKILIQNDFEDNNTTVVLFDFKLCLTFVKKATGTRSRGIIFPRLFHHSVLCSFAYGEKKFWEYPTGVSLQLE